MDNNNNRKFEDVYSDSSLEKPTFERGHKPLEQRDIVYPNKFVEFMAKDNKKNTKRMLIAIIALILLCIGALVAVMISDKLEKINFEQDGEAFTGDENYSENFDDTEFDSMHEISDAASLDDLLKKWYQLDGSIMKQDYVINVLLIGIDGKNGVKYGGNTDALILVSINKKTKSITLTSFMRDSRTYFEANGRSRVAKINAAYSAGGARTTVDAIEKDFKVDIDYYIAVDFTSFPKVIDALGGVTVDVQKYEQEYINRTTTKISKIPNYGEVKLNGSQALVYARVRKCDADGDVSRTRRQRSVISGIIDSAKNASLSQLNNAIDVLLPLLATDCPKADIISYATQALSQGWLKFDIKNITMPDEDTRADAKFDGIFYWVVDYPLAAQRVQTAIYGTSNIELDYNRESALDYVKYNSYSGSNGSSSSGEYTAAPSPTEAETTTKRNLFPWTLPGRDEPTTPAPQEPNTTTPNEVPGTTPATDAPEETTAAPSTTDSAEETTTKNILGEVVGGILGSIAIPETTANQEQTQEQ